MIARHISVLIGLGMLCIWLGCGLTDMSPPKDVNVLPIASLTPTSLPASSTPEATPTSMYNPCPELRTIAPPVRPAQFADYAATMREFLSQGGHPGDLVSMLTDWQARPSAGEVMAQADLTGDNVPETIVAYIDPESHFPDVNSELSIFTCRDQSVVMLYTYHPGEWFSLVLIGAQDMTADGVADLIFAEETCGAHTCWNTPHVWHWDEVDFVDKIGGDFSAPYATFMLEEGHIIYRSGGIASVGAGPQRPVTTTLAWNGSVVTVTDSGIGPSLYRYHVFRDGDEALFVGQDARAQMLYQQVLEDETLLSWADFTSAEEERRWFDALAHWRLLLVAAKAGDTTQAYSHYEYLISHFVPGKAGYAVTALADGFWQTYQQSQNLAYACRSALDVVEIQVALDYLNTFGYANPTYVKEDLCPYQD